MTMCKLHTQMLVDMRILAIDPGFDRLGIAVLEGNISNPILIWSSCIEPPKGEPQERLAVVFSSVSDVIRTYDPKLLAIEKLFFSTNKKTAMRVAEARGAVLVAAGKASLPVKEYSPQEVKIAVTGYGNADKKSIISMVPRLITLPKAKRLDDEYDAIAIGIAALAIRNV